MVYRKWTFEDILKISELEKECFSDPWTYRMFADAFSSKVFYGALAEENGEIAGYVCETILFENAEIDDFAVAEGYRRQGIGGRLLEYAETEARERGAATMFLEARVSNSPALLLYLKSGYRGIYTRPRYYPDGEDAVVLQKDLLSPRPSGRGKGKEKGL